MSSPIGRRTSRRRSSSPGRMAAMTVSPCGTRPASLHRVLFSCVRQRFHPYNAAMRRLLLILTCAALSPPSSSQNATPGSELDAMLRFEMEHGGTSPRGWGGGPAGTIFVDGQVVHGGRWSVRLERDASSPSGFLHHYKSDPHRLRGREDRVARVLAERSCERISGAMDAGGRRHSRPRLRQHAAAPGEGHARLDGILDYPARSSRREAALLRRSGRGNGESVGG